MIQTLKLNTSINYALIRYSLIIIGIQIIVHVLVNIPLDTEVFDGAVDSFTALPTESLLPQDASLPPAPAELKAEIVSQTFITLTWSLVVRPGVSPVTRYTVTTKQLGESRLVLFLTLLSRRYTITHNI